MKQEQITLAQMHTVVEALVKGEGVRDLIKVTKYPQDLGDFAIAALKKQNIVQTSNVDELRELAKKILREHPKDSTSFKIATLSLKAVEDM